MSDYKSREDFRMPFGKYRSKTLQEIFEQDNSYFNWLVKSIKADPKYTGNKSLRVQLDKFMKEAFGE